MAALAHFQVICKALVRVLFYRIPNFLIQRVPGVSGTRVHLYLVRPWPNLLLLPLLLLMRLLPELQRNIPLSLMLWLLLLSALVLLLLLLLLSTLVLLLLLLL